MRRAAQRARKPGRAGEYTWSESAATELPEIRPLRNPSTLSFSQSHGYGEIPSPLKLEDLPSEARTKLWNTLYGHLAECLYEDEDVGGVLISTPWNRILRAKHLHFDLLGMDEWSPLYHDAGHQLRDQIKTMRFNRVFDLIHFILRHPECPPTVAPSMKKAFSDSRLAYAIDENDPPTIIPAATREEGRVFLESMGRLLAAGLGGSAAHLRKACDCINENDWAGSIRESIHAVESVARQIAPNKTDTFTQALNSIEKCGPLHHNLKRGFQHLYWYASDEQGIRHALLNREEASVSMDEAVFMLGACASFASYLCRKNTVESPLELTDDSSTPSLLNPYKPPNSGGSV